ncbi:uncharacterized protein Triagg1_10430 [Trichoderma aggressivum f. europaeum]|uniref:Uncharacterized protein n=1 Tax=Trichoderma aggressivum f. europaeum TaxID=173218 RepID=A0AAE1I901_9HYPO|nr:hypothetical protein Triagg1_10430 [Trichoderma aggressivum f. europaeum]
MRTLPPPLGDDAIYVLLVAVDVGVIHSRSGRDVVIHLGARQIVGDLGLTTCTNSLKGEATVISTSDSNPLVMTPFDKIPIATPGKNNVVTAFINRLLNTKGACTVSKELVGPGFFSCGQHRLPDIQGRGPRQGPGRNNG